MSKFLDFASRLKNDESLRGDYLEIFKSNGLTPETPLSELSEKVIGDLIPVAKKAGYDFSVTEVKSYFSKDSSDELSEDELEGIAGGKNEVICINGAVGYKEVTLQELAEAQSKEQ